MIKLLLLAVVPFMTEHRNVSPRNEVSTNFYGSVTGIVDNAYIQAHGGGGVHTNDVIDIVSDEIIPATNRLNQTLGDAIDAHVSDTNNPHAVTAEQVGALPLVEDSYGDKTAVTIGNREGYRNVGKNSLANGEYVSAQADNSHAEGSLTKAVGPYSHAEGEGTIAAGLGSHTDGVRSQTLPDDEYAFAWNGDDAIDYLSHGPGTYNINPYGGLSGFWIGEQTLEEILTNKADKADISAENPTFSNDVIDIVRDEIIPATNSLYTTLNGSIDVKRGKADLAVYEVVRTENTNWTLVGNDGITTQCTSEWNGFGFAFYKDGVNVAASDTTVSRDAKTTTWAGSPEIGYSGVATRTSYMDESIVQNPDQHLAPVTTNGAGKVADGDMVKLGANARLVKAEAGTDYQDALPYPTNAIPWDVIANPPDIPVIDATDPTFSNAVLAVGLNIDTNSVAVLNDIAETFGGFPIESAATTVGGLLAALAAAVAWLKRNKVQTLKLEDNSVETSADGGVAKLDDFFANSNSLLNGRLAYSRNATGLKDRAFNALSFDGTEFDLSAALEAVTPTASGQPRDLLIVATATAATTISFTAGAIKGDKPTIDGSGTWLITLTEYASGVWYCRQIKMEDAA